MKKITLNFKLFYFSLIISSLSLSLINQTWSQEKVIYENLGAWCLQNKNQLPCGHRSINEALKNGICSVNKNPINGIETFGGYISNSANVENIVTTKCTFLCFGEKKYRYNVPFISINSEICDNAEVTGSKVSLQGKVVLKGNSKIKLGDRKFDFNNDLLLTGKTMINETNLHPHQTSFNFSGTIEDNFVIKRNSRSILSELCIPQIAPFPCGAKSRQEALDLGQCLMNKDGLIGGYVANSARVETQKVILPFLTQQSLKNFMEKNQNYSPTNAPMEELIGISENGLQTISYIGKDVEICDSAKVLGNQVHLSGQTILKGNFEVGGQSMLTAGTFVEGKLIDNKLQLSETAWDKKLNQQLKDSVQNLENLFTFHRQLLQSEIQLPELECQISKMELQKKKLFFESSTLVMEKQLIKNIDALLANHQTQLVNLFSSSVENYLQGLNAKCPICMVNPSHFNLVFPCGHTGICSNCLSDFFIRNMSSGQGSKCPFCNEPGETQNFSQFDFLNKKLFPTVDVD
jgi:hypothetical protein